MKTSKLERYELEQLAHLAEMRAGCEDTAAAYEAFIEALEHSSARLKEWWQDYYDALPWEAKLEVQLEMKVGKALDYLKSKRGWKMKTYYLASIVFYLVVAVLVLAVIRAAIA